MSQVVAGFGVGWLVVAADRGVTQVANDTGKVLYRWRQQTSKLMITDGYPIVLTATGPGYANDVIADYITGKTFMQEAGAVKTANQLWPLLCNRHKDDFGKKERRLSGMTFFAGAIDSLGIARVVTGDYPGKDLELRFIPRMGGEPQWTEIGSAFVMQGVHNARWDVALGQLTPAQGVEATSAVLDTVLRIEGIRRAAGDQDFVEAPFDVVLVTREGAQWIVKAQV